MDTGLLKGALAALVVLLLLSIVQAMLPDWTWRSGVGLFAPVDYLAVFTAMAAGGWVARQRRFRWVALGLYLLAWIATMLALLSVPAAPGTAAARAPMALLGTHALPVAIGLVVAVVGAMAGERVAQRRGAGVVASPQR